MRLVKQMYICLMMNRLLPLMATSLLSMTTKYLSRKPSVRYAAYGIPPSANAHARATAPKQTQLFRRLRTQCLQTSMVIAV